jgi:hypothetical protein
MRLRADTVNGNSSCNPGLYVFDHGLGFRVGGCVEAVEALVRQCARYGICEGLGVNTLWVEEDYGRNVLTCSR